MKIRYLIAWFLLTLNILFGQQKFKLSDDFNSIRKLELSDKLEIENKDDSDKNNLLKYRYNLLKYGVSIYPEKITDSTSVYAMLMIGDYQLNNHLEKHNDSLAYDYFLRVFTSTKKDLNNSIVLCEAIKRILQYHFKSQQNIKAFEFYSREYYRFAYDDFEKALANYYYLGVLLYKAHYNNEEHDDFLPLAIKFLEFSNENGFKYITGRILQLIGVYHDLFTKDYALAIESYKNSLSFYDSLNFHLAKKNANDMLFNIGALELDQNRPKAALDYFNKIDFKLYDKSDFKDRILIYDNIYRAFLNLKVLDSSIFYLQRKYEVNDSMEIFQKAAVVSELETKYRTAEKEKQILEEQQKVRTNRNWLIAAGLALLFGTGLAILLQKNTTKKRQLAEQEALLKQERVDNLLKEQELVSIDAMIEGQEKERQRVANELHDDLGSLMATIKLHFDNSKISKQDPSLQNAEKLLEEAYQKVRGMAHSKNSGVMSNQGLLPAIKKMAQVITETNALEVSVEAFGMGERLENSLELSLFRMVQELVANAIKHAEASTVSIQLTQHEDNLNIIIEDNGKGFDRSKIDTGKTGMGLTTIEKRVEHLEGNFTVDSVLGKGTSILIDIPV